MVTLHVNCKNWIEKPATFYITDSTEEIEKYIEENIDEYADEYEQNELKVYFDGKNLTFSDFIEASDFVKGWDLEQTERDGQKYFCVKLWTIETRIKSREILDNIDGVYIILYIACTINAIAVFAIKSKKRNR